MDMDGAALPLVLTSRDHDDETAIAEDAIGAREDESEG